MEMTLVDLEAFPQILEKGRKTLADSLIELTAKPYRGSLCFTYPFHTPRRVRCRARSVGVDSKVKSKNRPESLARNKGFWLD
jgi:hypothetical protein